TLARSEHPVGGRLSVSLVHGSADKGRDDQRQLPVQARRQGLALWQLVRPHLGDQVLEGAAVPVQAQVRQRARGQEASQKVERLGPRRGLPGAVGLPLLLRKTLANGLRRRLDELAVCLEERLGRRLVVWAGQLCATVVEVLAVLRA